jgi:hypothetical protein
MSTSGGKITDAFLTQLADKKELYTQLKAD